MVGDGAKGRTRMGRRVHLGPTLVGVLLVMSLVPLAAASGHAYAKSPDALSAQFVPRLASRMDTAEAFAPVRALGASPVVFFLLSGAAVATLSVLLARSTTRPLERTTAALAEANRDLERKVERLTAELERSNEELRRFAYVASHDLQEPLRMVASYTQLLRRRYRGKLDADADEFIDYAVDGATRMRTLLEDLLTYSRVGGQELRRAPVALDEVVEAVQRALAATVEATGALVASGPLPVVRADRGQMAQLLHNLVANALEFRRPGVRPEVRVSARRADGAWEVAVADNGIGIHPDHRDRVFEIFQRLHGRDEHAGTGMGLAVCRRIVERHGGRIRVDSAPGEGATFRFTLPDP